MNQDIRDTAASCTSLVELLQRRARHQPDQLAYIFLRNGRVESGSLTYAQLDRRARAIGAHLQSLDGAGQRAVLLYPAGLDVIEALFGCLYSGVIAIPAPPPEASRLRRTMPRLQSIAKDAEASLVLSTEGIVGLLEDARQDVAEFHAIRWLDTAQIGSDCADEWTNPGVGRGTLAYLQYTSGSTSSPKGVMVSHGNILFHCGSLKQACGYTSESVTATWMPYFHDYGLVEGLLQPLYNGTPCYLMSPYAFIKQPFHWLLAISRYRVTHSQGPNFAYALCVRRIKPEQRAKLDLSSWISAGNAAEPINPEVMEDFARTFEPHGFRWSSFSPAYGLAEATLLVSSTPVDHGPKFCHVEKVALEKGTVLATERGRSTRTVAGCGQLVCDTDVAIVDPETSKRCAPDVVGEVWVSDPSVAKGYWRRPEETKRTFLAYTADTGEGPFLRTGDLGFMRKGNLFICGRWKDIIIIRGSNYSPQDIEWTAQASHPALRPEAAAAFSVDVEGEERLVVAQEVIGRRLRDLDADKVVSAIRESAATQHELDIYAVALLRPGGVPKTSSGKVQRKACRQMFLDGRLETVACWMQSLESGQPESVAGRAHSSSDVTAVQRWLVAKIAELLNVDPEQVDIHEPFARYGLDSVGAVSLAGELESWLGCSLSATVAYDHPNIAALARYLSSGQTASSESSGRVVGPADDPIAIIGLGCRFPGAASPEAFWEQLRAGHDSITEVPAERWNVDAHYDPEPAKPAKMNTRWGGFLDQVDGFDAGFFGISPREATYMDPQQRLLLEVSWEALEHAGIAPSSLAGSQTGVFVGICSYDYGRLMSHCTAAQEAYSATGTALSIAANRLSFALDLHGPSLAVDTACSSSLVALHQACQSLRLGESSMAIAGGVNVILDPAQTIAFSQARMMASDGHCKVFSADADGYVRSEGCGMVVLKRLPDAVRDGDPILAMIRGTAVNQDGRSNGLTAPNGISQQDVVRRALAKAGVEPTEIGYVEAHGTGTPLGDPIEFNSLMEVLAPGRSPEQRCWVGSVKTNIGHLEAAAGIAGLMKAVLCLYRSEIPPNLHFSKLNSHISIEDAPFAIPTVVQPWKRLEQPRFAGVSSFGFGGTSAHVVLGEAPEAAPASSDVDRPLHVLTLSAKSEKALTELAGANRRCLGSQLAVPLADACFTANAGRSHFNHRAAIIGSSVEEMREQLGYLQANAGGQKSGILQGQVSSRKSQKIAFLFSAEGSEYHQMGRVLFETQPRFRRSIEFCDRILRDRLEKPLPSVLYGSPKDAGLLENPRYAHAALFALEYALADLWQSWGIEPAIVAGQGVGQYVAACVAGVFELEVALKLVTEWGGLKSGDEDQERLTSFERIAKEAVFSPAKIRMLSASGVPDPAGISTTEYWRDVLRQPEAPQDLVEMLRREACDLYLEIGPEPSLTKQLAPTVPGLCLQSLRRGRSDWAQLLESLAMVYVQGMAVDWYGFDRDYRRRRAILPTYPFQRKRYWFTSVSAREPFATPSPTAGNRNMMLAKGRVNGRIVRCLEEVERLSEAEVETRLRQFDSRHRNEDQRAEFEALLARLGGMSASRQELFARLLDVEQQRRGTERTEGLPGSITKEARITDAELDRLSESEAEALLLRKLDSLKF